MLSRCHAPSPCLPAGRSRRSLLAVLSPRPPGRRARPSASAAAAEPNRKGTTPTPSTDSDGPTTTPPASTTTTTSSSTSKAARLLLEELRALTFSRTLEREQQQQADVRRVRQRRSSSSSPAPPSLAAKRGSGLASYSIDPSSSSLDDDDNEDQDDSNDLLALAEEEGDNLLPRLPSSRAPAAAPSPNNADRRRSPSPSASAAAAAATTSARSPADGRASSTRPPAIPAECCYYFAFGANLSAATLRRRGVFEVYAHEQAFVEDPATRLAFRHRGGYATLRGGDIRAPGARGGSSGNSSSSRSGGGDSDGSGSNDDERRSVSPSRVGVLGWLNAASQARAPEEAGAEAASAAALAAASRAGGGSEGGSGHPPHVHGVLYALSRADLGRLAAAEGGYSLKEVDVVTYGGRRARALTFVSGAMASLPSDVRPTERYLSAIREGAADHHLEPLWQAWLSGLETVPSAGLGREYFDSPSRHLGTLFLAAALLALAAWTAGTAAPPV